MKKLKTIQIKGKSYITVNERVRAFREQCPEYSLESELVDVNAETALIRAIIRTNEGRIVATGTAYERRDNTASMVNRTSHVENCETSAWGRALANFGIGIDESIASAQEVASAVIKQAYIPPERTGSSVEQQGKIISLAKELGMDLDKDILIPSKFVWPPKANQADAIIKRLEQKKIELAKELDSKVNPSDV